MTAETIAIQAWENFGIPELDADHGRIEDLMRSLNGAAHARNLKEVKQLLADLLNQTRQHFTNEELAMRKSRYPDIWAHSNQHQTLSLDLAQLNQKLGTTMDWVALNRAIQFLPQWFSQHVLEADSKFAKWALKDRSGNR